MRDRRRETTDGRQETDEGSLHREITLIELQSLVVFGCAALLFMVGATASTHDREEGWDDFLFVYTE